LTPPVARDRLSHGANEVRMVKRSTDDDHDDDDDDEEEPCRTPTAW
jgi:hypothetical protein